VRTAGVVTLLGVVLTASALDLGLGIIWVAAVLGLIALRRRIRQAPVLVLLAAVSLLVGGGRIGWFTLPAPASYATGWIPFWGSPLPAALPESPTGPQILAARELLAAQSREELRLTGSEIEQRAGAVVALSRRIEPLRDAAPREAAAIEAAARRLARTLAAPEFRDLDARRTAAGAHLAELDRRLGTARDQSEATSILREADPVAMAQVSLRPVHDDLVSAEAAVDAILQTIGGGIPTATATATARLDEGSGEVRWEIQYAVADAPGVRLLRVETRPFRSAAPPGARVSLAYTAGGETPRPAPPGGWLELEPAPRGVTVAVTWSEPLVAHPIRPAFRTLPFKDITLGVAARADDVLVPAVLDGHPGIEIPLIVRLPPPSVTRVTLPGHALYFTSRPGRAATGPDEETWESNDEGAPSVRLELTPRSVFLRTSVFAWAAGYLYRPNLGTVVTAIGLAALTLVLIRRPRSADVATR
jgi:hypothetical protein